MEQGFPGVRIRAATNRDVESIKRLVFSVLREHGLPPQPESTDADLEDIEASYLRRGGLFEVVEDEGGRLLGTIGIYPLQDGACELRKMYFEPELRGRGMGRYLLERTLCNARQLGFRQIRLETVSVLGKAVRLYIRFGFKPFDSGHKSARSDQSYFLNL